MTHKLICDICEKEVTAPTNSLGDPYNPKGWYSRSIDGKTQHVCSRTCLSEIGGLVAPW